MGDQQRGALAGGGDDVAHERARGLQVEVRGHLAAHEDTGGVSQPSGTRATHVQMRTPRSAA